MVRASSGRFSEGVWRAPMIHYIGSSEPTTQAPPDSREADAGSDTLNIEGPFRTPGDPGRREQPTPVGFLVLLGLWFGLLTGLGEGAALFVARMAAPTLRFQGVDYYWMAPVAEGLLFALVALALTPVVLLVRPLRYWRWAFTAFAFLAVLTPLWSSQRIHPLSSLLIAAGVALQTGALVTKWFPGFPAWSGGVRSRSWRWCSPSRSAVAAGGSGRSTAACRRWGLRRRAPRTSCSSFWTPCGLPT